MGKPKSKRLPLPTIQIVGRAVYYQGRITTYYYKVTEETENGRLLFDNRLVWDRVHRSGILKGITKDKPRGMSPPEAAFGGLLKTRLDMFGLNRRSGVCVVLFRSSLVQSEKQTLSETAKRFLMTRVLRLVRKGVIHENR